MLRDKPLVRIHRPQLIELANVHPDYVSLLASVSRSVEDLAQTLDAVERGLADPAEQSGERGRVAADLFYKPGGATARSVHELYRLMELEPAPAVAADEERWRQSA